MTTLLQNGWLEEQDYRIRLKEIPWEGYQRASLLSPQDLGLLQAISGTHKLKRDAVWLKDPDIYAALYLRLLESLARSDCLQAVLVQLGDFFEENKDRVEILHTPSSYISLARHKDSSDTYIRIKSITLLAILIGSDPKASDEAVQAIVPAIDKLVQSQDSNEQEIGIQCLDQVLNQPNVRLSVWRAEESSSANKTGLLSSLSKLIQMGSKLNSQMQYRIGFCFWLFSFEVEIAENLNKKYGIINYLTEVIRIAVKEKVIRVLIATLKNLVVKAPDQNLAPMLITGTLYPLIQNLATRKWSDDELKEDVLFLKDQLQEAKTKMTTYDEYSNELESGLLHWSPPHTSDEFWINNAEKLNTKDYQQLKIIIKLLSESEDPLVLAVAANDLSKYVKYCDTGKKTAERLGAKSSVMNLMSHQNPDVKYWALISVQQLISQSWVL